jgi:V/A-type H+-transporting ATPase subunit D
MAKIKLTKTELKTQRDAMKQFLRFLPTLQLKKQQLQMEMRNCQAQLKEVQQREKALYEDVNSWVAMFAPNGDIKMLKDIVQIIGIAKTSRNVAGVEVPVLKEVEFDIKEYSLFKTSLWFDDGVEIIKQLITLKAEKTIIEEQYRLIGIELRTTTQRVNLFEKVKIPECKENIRVIQIYLGDMNVAAVGRSKIAKKKISGAA